MLLILLDVRPLARNWLAGQGIVILRIGRRIALRQHLTLCPLCRSLAEERLEFRTFFAANVPRDNTSPQLEANVLGAVRRAQASPPMFNSILKTSIGRLLKSAYSSWPEPTWKVHERNKPHAYQTLVYSRPRRSDSNRNPTKQGS